MKRILPILIMILLLSSCGGEIVARVGNTKITPDEFRFYLDSIKTQMQGTELKTDYDWENREIEGKKAIDVAKERAMENAIRNALYIESSKASGMTLTNEDIIQTKKVKNWIVDGYGGAEAYNQYLKDNNITDRFMNKMVESSAYQDKIKKRINAENPETDEEIMKYYEENKAELETRYRKAKHILILTTDAETKIPLPKTEKDKARRNAQHILKRVRSGEDFDALMFELSEDPGLAESPDGYVFKSGEMVPEFEECVDSIDYDDIALCESEYGFHIVKRLPVSLEDIKEYLKEEVQNKKVDELIYSWAEEFGVEIIKYEENYKDIK